MSVCEDITKCELLLMNPPQNINHADLEKIIHADFFEIGASGQRHDRASCMDTVMHRCESKCNVKSESCEAKDFECTEISNNIYLLTYILIQNKQRVTRRASIWKLNGAQWEIMYHQGTIVSR